MKMPKQNTETKGKIGYTGKWRLPLHGKPPIYLGRVASCNHGYSLYKYQVNISKYKTATTYAFILQWHAFQRFLIRQSLNWS